MDLSQKLAKNLKIRRGKLSQSEFARKLGISQPSLNRLENVCQNTTLKTLQQITKSLKCDISKLFE